jgi:hypothetical protein
LEIQAIFSTASFYKLNSKVLDLHFLFPAPEEVLVQEQVYLSRMKNASKVITVPLEVFRHWNSFVQQVSFAVKVLTNPKSVQLELFNEKLDNGLLMHANLVFRGTTVRQESFL